MFDRAYFRRKKKQGVDSNVAARAAKQNLGGAESMKNCIKQPFDNGELTGLTNYKTSTVYVQTFSNSASVFVGRVSVSYLFVSCQYCPINRGSALV